MENELQVTFKKFNFWNGVKFEITVNVPIFCANSNKTQMRAMFESIKESDTPEVREQFIKIMQMLLDPKFDYDLILEKLELVKIKKFLEDIDNGKL